MRLSLLKHPLAVLRVALGLSQKEMAALAECSTPTIQALELCKLNLSERLGSVIAAKTGVSLAWLLGGNPRAAMLSRWGHPYTPEVFDKVQAAEAASAKGRAAGDYFNANHVLATGFATMARALLAAHKTGQVELYAFKLSRALAEAVENLEGQEAIFEEMIAVIESAEKTGGDYNRVFDRLWRIYAEQAGKVFKRKAGQPPPTPRVGRKPKAGK